MLGRNRPRKRGPTAEQARGERHVITDYSSLWKEVVAQIELSMKTLGLTRKAYAARLGIEPTILGRILNSHMLPSDELSRRIVAVHQGYTFEDAPRMRVAFGPNKTKHRQLRAYLTESQLKKFDTLATSAGLTRQEMATYLMIRAIEDRGPVFILKHVAKDVKRAVVSELLRRFPAIAHVLELESYPASWRVHERKPVPYPPDMDGRTKGARLLEELQKAEPAYRDGPAHEIIQDDDLSVDF